VLCVYDISVWDVCFFPINRREGQITPSSSFCPPPSPVLSPSPRPFGSFGGDSASLSQGSVGKRTLAKEEKAGRGGEKLRRRERNWPGESEFEFQSKVAFTLLSQMKCRTEVYQMYLFQGWRLFQDMAFLSHPRPL